MGPFLNPWMLLGLALAFAAVGTGSFVAGVRVESNAAKAVRMAELEAVHAEYLEDIEAARQIEQSISKELIDAKSLREYDAVAFREELRRAGTSGKQLAACPQAPRERKPMAVAPPGSMPYPEPLPLPSAGFEPVFTAEFARLYDLALDIGRVPAAADPGKPHAATEGAGTVDAATVLAVHGDNAGAWAECRAGLSGWQALARRHGWVK